MKKKILLNTIDDVKKFVAAVSKYPGEVTLLSGRYVIDAKSIMGIFSLDLSKPVDMIIEDDVCEMDLAPLSEFICE